MRRGVTKWIGSRLLVAFVGLMVTTDADAAINVFSDGSDGAFNPTSNDSIDLGLAPTATWNTPGTGNGVYDPDKWAVVFKYSSVNIPAGVTVTFKNNASRAPVVWLVQGSAKIDGDVRLDGKSWWVANVPSPQRDDDAWGEPGPGGFRGARTLPTSSGFGPGGAFSRPLATITNDAQNSGTHNYGDPSAVALIGGSGGNRGLPANYDASLGMGGGGGGGAFLMAVADTLVLKGTVSADGAPGQFVGSLNWASPGAGGGGMVRILADVMQGAGSVSAQGSYFDGIVRFESNANYMTTVGIPAASLGTPSVPVKLWPDLSDPGLVPISVDGLPVSTSINGSLFFPFSDVSISTSLPVPLVFRGTNVPSFATITVRITPRAGDAFETNAVFTGNNTWWSSAYLPNGISAIQARASW